MLPSQVNLEELRATVSATITENAAQLSSRPSDSPHGFLEAMFDWVIRWWSRNSCQSFVEYEPFAFVHHPVGVSAPDPGEWSEALLFRERFSADMGGRIFLTTSPMLAVLSSATRCEGLEDIALALANFDFKALPTLIVDPAHNEVLYCPEGIVGDRITLALHGRKLTPVTVGNIDNALEDFHRDHTQYPEGYTHCFDDRRERVLRREAEAIIRDALFLQLKRDTFQTQYLAREEQLTVGRPDISIYEAPDLTRAACIFELKVLRSRGTTRQLRGKPKPYDDKTMWRHARMGLSQARKYKRATNAKLAYLVCFDGRDINAPQSDIEQLCDQYGVISKRYYMETSTRDDL
jgi:hypothetical protein